MEKLVIATRGSRLALWQANHVKDSLEAVHPGLAVELNIIKTKGDIILDVPLAKVGGKGLFVKEIEEALLSGAADIAVHSMKDVPMELPEGLILGIVPEREDPTDLFLSVDYDSLENLPAGAVVGTSSLRRQAQVLAQRPDLEVVSLRGNVDTRLRKLTEGQFAAIIMEAEHEADPEAMFDIVTLNSKSGLEGSNKNFAYAGSKFGGIGLTQSFALELCAYNIKVNAVCPGNFLDGPLWSDPVRGLFVQYLEAGKVPGAKTVADVRRYYEAKVPMNRGCLPVDVARAVMYCVEQKYETGQAIPVTGGQVMLN